MITWNLLESGRGRDKRGENRRHLVARPSILFLAQKEELISSFKNARNITIVCRMNNSHSLLFLR